MSRRVALLIANSEYDDPQLKRLKTPVRDAERLAEVLRDPEIGGFDDVKLLVNRTWQELRPLIARFYLGKRQKDLLLFYYTGHGIKDDSGELYLATKNTEFEIASSTTLDSSHIKKSIESSHSRRKVVILDSCYSGAFGGSKAVGHDAGVREAFQGYGQVILTASNAVELAWEGDKLSGKTEMSVFTRYLVEGLRTGQADINQDGEVTPDDLHEFVLKQIRRSGSSKQTPQKYVQAGVGHIMIARNPHLPPSVLPVDLRRALLSQQVWMRLGAVSGLNRLMQDEEAVVAAAARTALERLQDDGNRQVSSAATLVLTPESGSQVVSPPPPRPRPAKTPPDHLTITTPIRMELVRIPAGEFLMGSDPAKDKNADSDEQPQHTVYLSEYYIGKYPVTHAQYAAFVKAAKHKSQGGWSSIPSGKKDHPVVDVSWNDAVAFCEWLSEESGRKITLPTEAQWEKAARGPSSSSGQGADGRIYPWGNEWDATRANTKEGGLGDTTPVGQYSPIGDSPYDVADMSGNVWEWCVDDWDRAAYKDRDKKPVRDPLVSGKSSWKVIRGGSYYHDYTLARCAYRVRHYFPFYWLYDLGFRVACAPLLSDL